MNRSALDAREDFGRRALRAAGAAVLVASSVLLLVFEGRVLMVLLAGGLFCLALRGTSTWVSEKTHLPYAASLAAIALLVVAGIGFGLFSLGSGLAAQADAFATQIPNAWHSLLDAIQHRPAVAQVVGPLAGKTPTVGADMAKVAASASGAFEVVGSLVVVFFLGIYGAAQPDAYSRVVVTLVPPGHKEKARLILAEMGTALTRWLAGRAVAMLIVGVLVTIGLVAMKIPLAWPLGMLAGLLTFVEYLGAFLSAGPAMLLAFTRGTGLVVGTAVLFTVAHILEGYVLTPFLVRSTVKFPPAYTLAAQVVLGAIFGVVGLTFATPVMILATILVQRTYVDGQMSKAREHRAAAAAE